MFSCLLILSLDYRHQEDETVASRGSISMKTAILKIAPAGEKLRFEVHSTPSRGHHSGVQKWYMKANHPVEAHRWTQALGKSIEWYKREDTESRKSADSDSNSTRPTLHHRGTLSSSLLPRSADGASALSLLDGPGDEDFFGESGRTKDSSRANFLDDDEEEEGNDGSSVSGSTGRDVTPPHDANFELHGNSTIAQMELTSQLLSNLSIPSDAPARTQELKTALRESLSVVQGMVSQYVEMSKEREEWWKSKVDRERDRQRLWEESLQFVVKEGEDLEKQLRIKSRRRGSRMFDSSVGDGRTTLRERKKSLPQLPPFTPTAEQETSNLPQDAIVVSPITKAAGLGSPLGVETPTPQTHQKHLVTPPVQSPMEDEDMDTDDEDEFFDAIESNNLPNLLVPDSLKKPVHPETLLPEYDSGPYMGYKQLRQRLALSNDNRPSTSLWSVLKHSIGKDLTKISFPVFFNEPTSMLQRMVNAHLSYLKRLS
jgi:oxysterol-binding protein 1